MGYFTLTAFKIITPPPPAFLSSFFFTFLHFYFHVIIPSFSPFPKHSHFCYTLRMKKIPDYTTIYQDEQIVVLNKRSGLLIASDRYDLEAPRLDLEAEKEFGKLYAVHRIDKDTSGIIIYARNPEAHKALSMQFQEREVEKNLPLPGTRSPAMDRPYCKSSTCQ